MSGGSQVTKRASALLSVWAFLSAGPASAATFDGSTELICSFMEAIECDREGTCAEGEADDVLLADFVRIDFKKKQMTLLDEERRGETTAIQRIEKLEDRLMLQGIEGARGWSLTIAYDSGDTVLAVSGSGAAFVAFGECTRP